ncbi:MAG: TRAP transporter substrate-binding protein [Gammaproteobacteria bacterium]|nr:TRAP transporter substrate-binding protein [Gammaproteobacteria bacterium]
MSLKIRAMVLSGVAAVALAATPMAASAKKIMNIGYAVSQAHPYGTFMSTFAERLTAMSNGEIKVKVHCCFKMGGEQDMFKKLQLGTLDGTLIAQNNAGPFYPKIDLLVLPYMLQSYEHALRIVDGPVGEQIWGDMPKDAKVHMVKIPLVSFRHFYNTKGPINSIEDFKPLKYRVPKNVVMVDTYKAFGSDPVPIAWSETLTAVQTGTVDGGDLPIDGIYSQKFHEVAKHIAYSGHFALTPIFVVSNKFMDKLDDGEKELMRMAADIAAAASRHHTLAAEAGIVEKLKTLGVKFTSPDKAPFIKAAGKVHAAFAKERGAEYVKLIDAISAEAK